MRSVRPTPGATITANVRLLRPIASGVMSAVWLADHLTLGTQVAVKLVPDAADEEMFARFEREAKAAAQLKSQHVVQIYDYGKTPDGTPYMVLELLEGESLAARLARHKRLSLDDCDVVVSHTARALTKAHAIDIIHRDIKPSNLFLTHTEEGLWVKVLDFGVAKRLQGGRAGDLTADGVIIGTPPFMSPEQILYGSGKLSPQADLWSLAVTAYLGLGGQLPFSGATLDELSLAVFQASPTRLSVLRPDLPDAFDAFFARAFHKKADQRFATAMDLARAFHAITELVTRDDVATVPVDVSRLRLPKD
jgi:serine/threonine protein kinase